MSQDRLERDPTPIPYPCKTCKFANGKCCGCALEHFYPKMPYCANCMSKRSFPLWDGERNVTWIDSANIGCIPGECLSSGEGKQVGNPRIEQARIAQETTELYFEYKKKEKERLEEEEGKKRGARSQGQI